ncbi:MAG: hypothetical protein SFX18_02020 [Pirellulales bacterium]|nr:hypothetical protein [Pirellulales bacterium]
MENPYQSPQTVDTPPRVAADGKKSLLPLISPVLVFWVGSAFWHYVTTSIMFKRSATIFDWFILAANLIALLPLACYCACYGIHALQRHLVTVVIIAILLGVELVVVLVWIAFFS